MKLVHPARHLRPRYGGQRGTWPTGGRSTEEKRLAAWPSSASRCEPRNELWGRETIETPLNPPAAKGAQGAPLLPPGDFGIVPVGPLSLGWCVGVGLPQAAKPKISPAATTTHLNFLGALRTMSLYPGSGHVIVSVNGSWESSCMPGYGDSTDASPPTAESERKLEVTGSIGSFDVCSSPYRFVAIPSSTSRSRRA
jgi:hypothetical protein